MSSATSGVLDRMSMLWQRVEAAGLDAQERPAHVEEMTALAGELVSILGAEAALDGDLVTRGELDRRRDDAVASWRARNPGRPLPF